MWSIEGWSWESFRCGEKTGRKPFSARREQLHCLLILFNAHPNKPRVRGRGLTWSRVAVRRALLVVFLVLSHPSAASATSQPRSFQTTNYLAGERAPTTRARSGRDSIEFENRRQVAMSSSTTALPAERVAELRQAIHCQVTKMGIKGQIQRCLADSRDRSEPCTSELLPI